MGHFTVNGIEKQLVEPETLFQLLSSLELAQSKGLAVAVNDLVIPKKEWEQFNVSENDKITIIRATQGG